MANITNKNEVVKFNAGNMFSQLTLGGNDFVLITKNNPYFVNYVKSRKVYAELSLIRRPLSIIPTIPLYTMYSLLL